MVMKRATKRLAKKVEDKILTGSPIVTVDEIKRLRYIAKDYEELRKVIDEGSESMNHKDAIRAVMRLKQFYRGGAPVLVKGKRP